MKDENKSLPVIYSEDDVPETMLEEINNGKGEDENE